MKSTLKTALLALLCSVPSTGFASSDDAEEMVRNPITPFSLVYAGYQGRYSEYTTESGHRLGSAGTFCNLARRMESAVAVALADAAIDNGRLSDQMATDSYLNSVEDMLHSICED